MESAPMVVTSAPQSQVLMSLAMVFVYPLARDYVKGFERSTQAGSRATDLRMWWSCIGGTFAQRAKSAWGELSAGAFLRLGMVGGLACEGVGFKLRARRRRYGNQFTSTSC
jgi:hypothetical protein